MNSKKLCSNLQMSNQNSEINLESTFLTVNGESIILLYDEIDIEDWKLSKESLSDHHKYIEF